MPAALLGIFWEDRPPPFLLLSSPQVLGSNSGWQSRFRGSKGCRLSCPTATNAQGSVQEAWSPCRAQGTHPGGAQASESVLIDPPVCRLRETLVWVPRVGMASDGRVSGPCTVSGCATGHTTEGLKCQAEWANLIVWVKADGAGTLEAMGGAGMSGGKQEHQGAISAGPVRWAGQLALGTPSGERLPAPFSWL